MIPKAKLAGLTAKQREFVLSIDSNTEDLTAVSTGICPGCETCREEFAPALSAEEFDEAVSSGRVYDGGAFSRQGCDLCGSPLGGTFEVWHAVDTEGVIVHGERACVDCVCHLANDALPGANDE